MSTELHYELTSIIKPLYPGPRALYRIRATRDLPQHSVKKGDFGGYVESTDNLAGEAWLADESSASGQALVDGTARLSDNATASDYVHITGNARLRHNSRAGGHSNISGNVIFSNHASAAGNAKLDGSIHMRERAHSTDNSQISGHVNLSGGIIIYGDTRILSLPINERPGAKVTPRTRFKQISLNGEYRIGANAEIKDSLHALSVPLQTTSSTEHSVTLYRAEAGGAMVDAGHGWTGTLHQFRTLIEEARYEPASAAEDNIFTHQPWVSMNAEMQAVVNLFEARITRW